MDKLIISFSEGLAQNGPLFIALEIAIWYLQKGMAKHAEANESLVKTMNEERAQRISVLETHVVECNEKHAAAQQKYEKLLRRVAKLDHEQV